MAPEVGLVSATTHFIEFSTIGYNNLRHFTSSFRHVPNGVYHYKFLTVLLTVSTLTKMRLSSGNIHRVEMGKIFKTLNLQSEAEVGIGQALLVLTCCAFLSQTPARTQITKNTLLTLAYLQVFSLLSRLGINHLKLRYYSGTGPLELRCWQICWQSNTQKNFRYLKLCH